MNKKNKIILPLITLLGQEKKTVEFFIDEPSLGANKIITASYLCSSARQRKSNAKVKLMSEISGTTAKPWNQKGSGRARQGSKRSVQFVGGRTCHGPSEANYKYSLPKKIVNKSIAEAIRIKAIAGKIFLFSDDLTVEKNSCKTSSLASAMKAKGFDSALVITSSELVRRAAKNIKGLIVDSPRSLKIFNILKFENIIIDKAELSKGECPFFSIFLK